MSGAELSQSSGAPDGEPEPGIIELAPENPVALHIIPRQTPEEMEGWFALKTAAQRAADRRLSSNTEEASTALHPEAASEEAPAPFRVTLDEEEVRDSSEQRRKALLAQKRLEGLRQRIFAKGIGVQTTPQELKQADAVLKWHNKTVHPKNKRSLRRAAW